MKLEELSVKLRKKKRIKDIKRLLRIDKELEGIRSEFNNVVEKQGKKLTSLIELSDDELVKKIEKNVRRLEADISDNRNIVLRDRLDVKKRINNLSD